MTFDPAPGDIITLCGRRLRAQGNEADRALRVRAGRATVHAFVDTTTNGLYALKVMDEGWRIPALTRNCDLLAALSPIPGFEACQQRYVTPELDFEILRRHPCLIYANLMPWIMAQPWHYAFKQGEIDARTGLRLAYELAALGQVLEHNDLAHCDLSGSNVLVDVGACRVFLIDFDELYWPGAPPPPEIPVGTVGYRKKEHRQWSPSGDRFALAVLIVEMLCAHEAQVRGARSGDSYFSDKDLSATTSHRYAIVNRFLREHIHPWVAARFDQAWHAPAGDQCPRAADWASALRLADSSLPLRPPSRIQIPPVQRAVIMPLERPRRRLWRPW